jgi:ComEC/Rec2-related protein
MHLITFMRNKLYIGIFIFLVIDSYLLNYSAYLSQLFNNNCKNMADAAPLLSAVQNGLICGVNIMPKEISNHLKKLGIIHWFVVSGAHLIFIEKLLTGLKIGYRPLLLLILFFYALVAGMNAPVMRAFVNILFIYWLSESTNSWPTLIISLISGLSTIFLFPQFLLSQSFYLSWACSLILLLCQNFSRNKKSQTTMISSVAIYFGLIPFLISLGIPHPISIFINLLFNSVFSIFLFPITVLSMFFSQLRPLCLFLWENLFRLFELIGHEISPMPSIGRFHAFSILMLIIGIHIYSYTRYIRCKRSELCEL